MRKLFTFLFAALMSAGMFAATEVTITQNDFPYPYGSSLTKDGVTVSGDMDGMEGSLVMGGSFSTTLGNFTKIEVTADDVSISGTGWTGNYAKMTWTGNASSVSFSGNIMGNGQGVTLKFTIEEPTVAVTGVTLNQNEAQMTVGGETLTLTATVNPNNATDQSVSWSTSDANVATVENGVVTAVAAGNATITVTTTDGSFTATCAVTVTDAEPAPQPVTIQATQFNVPANWEINADPITASDLPGFTAATTEQAMALANDLLAANPNLFATLIYGLGNNVLYIIINGPYSAPEADSNPYYTKGSAWEDQYEYYNTVFYTSGGDEPQPTGVENVQSDKVQGTKFFRDGQLLIEKNGKTYNATGAEVK